MYFIRYYEKRGASVLIRTNELTWLAGWQLHIYAHAVTVTCVLLVFWSSQFRLVHSLRATAWRQQGLTTISLRDACSHSHRVRDTLCVVRRDAVS